MDNNNMDSNGQYGNSDGNYQQQYGSSDGNYQQQFGSGDGNYQQQQFGSSDGNYQQQWFGSNDGSYQQPQFGGTGYGNQQYQYNNDSYQMPYQAPPQTDLEEPVKLGEWIIAILLMSVPCVNIIMMFVWAFGKNEKKSKSNFFKAYLIVMGALFVLYFVLIIFCVAVLGTDILSELG